MLRTMRLNGANIAENIDLSASGNRLRLVRDVDDALDRRRVDRECCRREVLPQQRCAIRPPNEWPMTIGLGSDALTIQA